MAEVIRCDICGSIDEPQRTKFVKLTCKRTLQVFDVDISNCIDNPIIVKQDICISCYRRLNEFLGVLRNGANDPM